MGLIKAIGTGENCEKPYSIEPLKHLIIRNLRFIVRQVSNENK